MDSEISKKYPIYDYLTRPSSLVIIGNGFDLHCHYETTFKDFFNDKKMNSNTDFITNCFVKYFKDLGRNNAYLQDWSDVEKQISLIFENHFCLRNYYERDSKLCSSSPAYDRQIYESWLQKEFKLFEQLFIEYLNGLNINREEDKNSLKLIEDICKEYLRAFILDFNYTPFFLSLKENTIHVHGSVQDKNIIIGYDEFDFLENKKENFPDLPFFAKQFTKTFRKLDLSSTGKFFLPKEINSIIFYGHSLSGNDYSYFQSIFDFYNIYQSDIVLDFVYSLIPGHKIEVDKLAMQKKVYSLIQKYGESFDNKTHGRNLLHKLLVEGRIGIRCIESNN